MKLESFVLALLVSSQVWAGKFEIIGEGTASVAAEFIRIQIAVASECHASALAARQAVDALSKQAVQALDKYKTEIPQQLSISPGANAQKVKTVYRNNAEVVICDQNHSWTSTNQIQFKLDNLNLLAEVQDALLALNDQNNVTNEINKAKVALAIATPEPGVLADTWDTISDLALKRAHGNALRQVKVLSEGMNQLKIELVKVEATPQASGQILYDRVDREGDTSGASLGTVSLKLSRKFTFKVESQP